MGVRLIWTAFVFYKQRPSDHTRDQFLEVRLGLFSSLRNPLLPWALRQKGHRRTRARLSLPFAAYARHGEFSAKGLVVCGRQFIETTAVFHPRYESPSNFVPRDSRQILHFIDFVQMEELKQVQSASVPPPYITIPLWTICRVYDDTGYE